MQAILTSTLDQMARFGGTAYDPTSVDGKASFDMLRASLNLEIPVVATKDQANRFKKPLTAEQKAGLPLLGSQAAPVAIWPGGECKSSLSI